jgi:hypothetical protein
LQASKLLLHPKNRAVLVSVSVPAGTSVQSNQDEERNVVDDNDNSLFVALVVWTFSVKPMFVVSKVDGCCWLVAVSIYGCLNHQDKKGHQPQGQPSHCHSTMMINYYQALSPIHSFLPSIHKHHRPLFLDDTRITGGDITSSTVNTGGARNHRLVPCCEVTLDRRSRFVVLHAVASSLAIKSRLPRLIFRKLGNLRPFNDS